MTSDLLADRQIIYSTEIRACLRACTRRQKEGCSEPKKPLLAPERVNKNMDVHMSCNRGY